MPRLIRLLLFGSLLLTACRCKVPSDRLARLEINRTWQPQILRPGEHEVPWHARVHFLDVTSHVVNDSVRFWSGETYWQVNYNLVCQIKTANTQACQAAFEKTGRDQNLVSPEDIYYLELRQTVAQLIGEHYRQTHFDEGELRHAILEAAGSNQVITTYEFRVLDKYQV